jgi:hypothetical protein
MIKDIPPKLFDEFDFSFVEYGNEDLSDPEIIKNQINLRFYMLERYMHEKTEEQVVKEINDLASFILYLPYQATKLTFNQKTYFYCILEGCRHYRWYFGLTKEEKLNLRKTYLASFGIRK